MGVRHTGGRTELELPGGVHGVAMRFTSGDPISLDPAEEALAAGMGQVRRADFAAGRACARHALERLGAGGPVLARADGAPCWPPTVCGSISHKDGLAVALVGSADAVGSLGVDLEAAQPLPAAVWTTVLTSAELDRLRAEHQDPGLAGRLAFSAKEAYYKWFRSAGRTDPIGFGDIEVRRAGSALLFRSAEPGGFPEPEGMAVRIGGWLMTVACGRAGAG